MDSSLTNVIKITKDSDVLPMFSSDNYDIEKSSVVTFLELSFLGSER